MSNYTGHGLAISINKVLSKISNDPAFLSAIDNGNVLDMLLILKAYKFKATINNALLIFESVSRETRDTKQGANSTASIIELMKPLISEAPFCLLRDGFLSIAKSKDSGKKKEAIAAAENPREFYETHPNQRTRYSKSYVKPSIYLAFCGIEF